MSRYFNYCSNARCDNHRGIAGWTDVPLGSAAPRSCPICGSPLVYTEYEDPVFELDPFVIRGRTPASLDVGNGVVLDPVPYHGHRLALGDNDAERRFGGEEHPDDDIAHVAQLKRDLLLLGYYSPNRGGVDRGHVGQFHLHVVAAVVAFKYDLIHEYGVRCRAVADPVTEIETLSIHTAGPIQYDETIQNPYHPDFAQLYRQIVGDRFLRGLLDNLTSAQDGWHGRTGWRTASESEQARHSASRGPYLQPAIPTRILRVLRNVCSNARTAMNCVLLTGVSGEPSNPELGAPLSDEVLDWIQVLEDAISGLNRACDSVWADLQAWDTGNGPAQALRDEIPRAEGQHRARLADSLASWDEYKELWSSLRLQIRTLVAGIRAYVRRNLQSFRDYRSVLIANGTVDTATAMYIKHILLHGTLPGPEGDRGVFVCPTNELIDDLGDGESITSVIESLCEEHDVPSAIMIRQIQHESGSSQSTRISGIRVPTYGVDWNNVGARHSYHEVLTRTDPWRWSCGWGATQYTTFSDPVQGVAHRAGIPLSASSERPLPEYIRSIRGNLAIGIRLLRTKFDRTTVQHPPRDCTFTPRFACTRCLRPSRFGCQTPDQVVALLRPTDRLGHPIAGEAGNQFSYYFALPAERMRLLGWTGEDTPRARVEWPCSWLAAKIHYGGSGPQAWRAFRGAVATLSRDGAAEEAALTSSTSIAGSSP